VRDSWARFIEVPHDVQIHMVAFNDHEYHWGLDSAKAPIAFTFRSANIHGNVCIFDGSHTFVAEQLSRNLGIKVPPLMSDGTPFKARAKD
jgi:hypothetical protein